MSCALSTKRPIDLIDASCSPQSHHVMSLMSTPQQFNKRSRLSHDSAWSPPPSHYMATSPTPPHAASPLRPRNANAAVQSNSVNQRNVTVNNNNNTHQEEGDISAFHTTSIPLPVEKYMPYAKRRRTTDNTCSNDMDALFEVALRRAVAHAQNGVNGVETVQAMQGNVTEKHKDRLFSLDQVRLIVAKAVEEREAEVREEYDIVLKERLDEQYRDFSKFNEDYVSRQLKESNWSYMS